ncbi:stage V sporulation protein AD [Aneurinibacillus aneurinilyticus]|jgi:stage V sporulation protein AD|uniref:Stage V sporulation protein AD n=2 Tax=Aneurinibacillus aneurinilyticus TaxID=1391 RepID=A0A848CS15_ANEAE|nr:stage V sporulation protein AD [Aneurinibacillus aneurinilyticus]ERI05950.1 stage V sporulation protein AD [Aneurinibacillus aneurinilyticus ATCC 12856]MCI1692701.1 stage V sporulation protein AD [Aneurinibacillus aneurinilyticus]MED0672710.1 stage V sporulation protein AD [Aneurinibacillus aneurinilyticus]MED0708537.1 stage V sporulation protein AD [Aneurinibacillus aneurinilyticus]MED0721697.1 stage V sporulation protein AD [Aneurinibacillus aneurinilyticus]
MKAQHQYGRQTWKFANDVRVQGSAVAVGPLEGEGPLGAEFDHIYPDMYAGQASWEKAERYMMYQAVQTAVKKSNLLESEIDIVLAGDLLNQTISSNFTASQLNIPLLGMFGACSTSMETLSVGSALVDAGYASYVVATCSSHNCTAEKQFRYPTEYGGQKPDYAQWTVTGAGAVVVGRGGSGPCITHATIGKVVDMGIKDPFDMGSAMAPAAADTLSTHFHDTDRLPSDYDIIVTGDLGKVGYAILKDEMRGLSFDMTPVYNDCGLMIYGPDQQVFSGGSGCASSAVVTYSYIMNRLRDGSIKRALICATGALFSPVSYQQGESIPCIAHAVALEAKEE